MTIREWVLVVLLLSLIQGFIWYAAFVNAGNGSALNYISFAGTLISIILAVLAIGYTYGESISEKSKGDTLASQISSLSEITRGIKIQSESLDKVIEIKSELSDIARRIEDGLQDTREKVSGMTGSLESVTQKMDGFFEEKKKTIKASKVDKGEAVQSIMAARSPMTEISILFILLMKQMNISKNFDGVINVVEKYVGLAIPEHNSDVQESVKYSFSGAVLSLVPVLQGFELIIIEGEHIKYIDDSLLKEVKNSICSNSICVEGLGILLRDKLLSDLNLSS